MGKGSRWASAIYPLKESKWSCCCLPPDRVKLTVNSKKETNSRVKMGKESKWAKSQDGLLFFTPWKSQNVLLLFTPWQSQTNWTAQKKQRVGSNWTKRVKLGLAHFDSETIESNWAKRSQVGPKGVKLGQAHFDSESNRAKESRWVGTSSSRHMRHISIIRDRTCWKLYLFSVCREKHWQYLV